MTHISGLFRKLLTDAMKDSRYHHSSSSSSSAVGSRTYGQMEGIPALDLGHGKAVNARAQARIPKPVLGWKKGNGNFSAKAKKEYLRWKKQQRRLGSDDSEEETPDPNAAFLDPEKPPLGLPLDSDHVTAGEDGEAGSVADVDGVAAGAVQQQQQPRAVPAKLSASAAASAAEAAKTMAELKGQPVAGGSKKYKQFKAAPNEAPLEYFELEALPEGDVPEGALGTGTGQATGEADPAPFLAVVHQVMSDFLPGCYSSCHHLPPQVMMSTLNPGLCILLCAELCFAVEAVSS